MDGALWLKTWDPLIGKPIGGRIFHSQAEPRTLRTAVGAMVISNSSFSGGGKRKNRDQTYSLRGSHGRRLARSTWHNS